MSGTHPSSVTGTVIWSKYITKSNAPIARPSKTVRLRPRPRWASRLPVTSATAPCPAAIARAVTIPRNSVSITADLPGL